MGSAVGVGVGASAGAVAATEASEERREGWCKLLRLEHYF